MKLGKTGTRIVSAAVIVTGISLLISSLVLTTGFIMGIALILVGVSIILLSKRQSLKPKT